MRQPAALHLEPPHLCRGGHTVRHTSQCRWCRQPLDHGAACVAHMASRFLRHYLQQPVSLVRRQLLQHGGRLHPCPAHHRRVRQPPHTAPRRPQHLGGRHVGLGLRPVLVARFSLHRLHHGILHHHQCSRLRQHGDAPPNRGPLFCLHLLRHLHREPATALVPLHHGTWRYRQRPNHCDQCGGLRQRDYLSSACPLEQPHHRTRHGVRQRAALHLEPPHLCRGGHAVRHAAQCRRSR